MTSGDGGRIAHPTRLPVLQARRSGHRWEPPAGVFCKRARCIQGFLTIPGFAWHAVQGGVPMTAKGQVVPAAWEALPSHCKRCRPPGRIVVLPGQTAWLGRMPGTSGNALLKICGAMTVMAAGGQPKVRAGKRTLRTVCHRVALPDLLFSSNTPRGASALSTRANARISGASSGTTLRGSARSGRVEWAAGADGASDRLGCNSHLPWTFPAARARSLRTPHARFPWQRR